jgi:tight adherence protein B
MNDTVVWMITVAVAGAIALAVWAVIEIGTNGLALYRKTFTERANFSLRELFLFVDPSKLYALNIALILLLFALGWLLTGTIWVGLVAAAIAAVCPRFVLNFMRKKRMEKIEEQLPDVLLMLAGGLKAGVSLTGAVQQLVKESRPPISQEFDLLLREQRLGVGLDVALENLNVRVPLQSMTLAVSAMRIATETGGSLAETLERASQTLRNKLAMEGKIRALTAQGKLQAWVVGALPFFLLVVLLRMEPVDMPKIFTTQMGWGTLACMVVMEFFGILLIRKIINIDV